MRHVLVLLALTMVTLAGCASTPEVEVPPPEPTLPTVNPGVSIHIPDSGIADDMFAALAASTGTYYSIGTTTFEPTIGVTSSGTLFIPSLKREAGVPPDQSTHVIRSQDQGQTWEDVGPFAGPTGIRQVPNSNDPFLFVDPWTDRVINFDMCLTLSGFCFEYSDDEGDSWILQTVATGEAPALDHQSIAAAPSTEGVPTVGYPNVLVFCVNRGPTVAGSWCSSSFDGGIGWTPLAPGYPAGTSQCSGLSAHVVGAEDGRFYRGNPSCRGPAVYRSEDGGLTWTEHTITTEGGVRGHEVATGVDDEGNVYAFWIASDGLPYLAVSMDHADTWSEPRMVAADGVTAAGFPTVAGGANGNVAFAYIGTDAQDGYGGDSASMAWTGYIGISLDALSDNATWANVAVNDPDDPLDEGRPCGAIRCGGFGDFIDITIDAEGRPWAAMAHNGHGNAGLAVTLAEGPSLRAMGPLPPLELGGTGQW